MQSSRTFEDLLAHVVNHLGQIYPGEDLQRLARNLISDIGLNENYEPKNSSKNYWDQSDIALITYGNTLVEEGEQPLNTLHQFLNGHLKNSISIVHILPFFPFSSDDGFAVINYTQVNDGLGGWEDIEGIAVDYKLMSDLVINHCSSRSLWFEQFKQDKTPGKDFFFTATPDHDLSNVVRPRTNPLLKEVATNAGTKYVWCTFSHDQVDLDFSNPTVLREFVKIIHFYLQRGVKIFRLDAVAFLWKQIGTNCLNLPQTHEIVRLLRTLIEAYDPGSLIITETNIPNRENLSYFGNANEAHLIYNFSLPPLLVNTLVTGNCKHLKNWMMSMPPAQLGTAYFNFIASHDGIGLRPVEGLLDNDELNELTTSMQEFGGHISWRALENGDNRPYEINIALYDALKGTIKNGPDQWQQQRFICAHAIMLALEGIPAFYIHSLLATENDHKKREHSNNNRAINRHIWPLEEIEQHLSGTSHHADIFSELCRLIKIRKQQEAFHPNATQFTMHLGEQIFAFWRQSPSRDQSIFCLNNISDDEQVLRLMDINLIITDDWQDLITGTVYGDQRASIHMKPYQTLWLTNKF